MARALLFKRAVDRPIDSQTLKRASRRKAGIAGLALAAVSAGFVWGPSLLRPTVLRSRIRTAVVDQGPIDATITAAGTVLPEIEEVLSSPVDARVLKILKRAGSALKQGEPILELDLSESRLGVQKLDQDFAIKANQQARTKLDLEGRLLDLQSQSDIKRLQLQSFESQQKRTQALHAEGLVSDEALHLAELAAAQAAIELKKLEGEKDNAARAATTQFEGLALEMATLRRQRDEAQRQLTLATTKADRDGVLTWTLAEEGVAVHKGDVIARIADLSAFRVDATVSDVHARRLLPGQPVVVKAPGGDLEGSVARILPTIQNGALTLSVALADKASPLLRSNLRVDVVIVTARKADTLRVKRGPFADAEGVRDVFVVRGDRAFRTSAQMGVASFDQLEVLKGLEKGDEVVVSDMSQYLHLKEVRIR